MEFSRLKLIANILQHWNCNMNCLLSVFLYKSLINLIWISNLFSFQNYSFVRVSFIFSSYNCHFFKFFVFFVNINMTDILKRLKLINYKYFPKIQRRFRASCKQHYAVKHSFLESTICTPQIQSTCHYTVNHYVKIWHVRLGGATNMHPLSWGDTNGKDPQSAS